MFLFSWKWLIFSGNLKTITHFIFERLAIIGSIRRNTFCKSDEKWNCSIHNLIPKCFKLARRSFNWFITVDCIIQIPFDLIRMSWEIIVYFEVIDWLVWVILILKIKQETEIITKSSIIFLHNFEDYGTVFSDHSTYTEHIEIGL